MDEVRKLFKIVFDGVDAYHNGSILLYSSRRLRRNVGVLSKEVDGELVPPTVGNRKYHSPQLSVSWSKPLLITLLYPPGNFILLLRGDSLLM